MIAASHSSLFILHFLLVLRFYEDGNNHEDEAKKANKWSHHEISYDEESGLLECKIDSRVEALKYITEGGREGKTICQPVLGEVASISIAPAYTGCVDDFRIL